MSASKGTEPTGQASLPTEEEDWEALARSLSPAELLRRLKETRTWRKKYQDADWEVAFSAAHSILRVAFELRSAPLISVIDEFSGYSNSIFLSLVNGFSSFLSAPSRSTRSTALRDSEFKAALTCCLANLTPDPDREVTVVAPNGTKTQKRVKALLITLFNRGLDPRELLAAEIERHLNSSEEHTLDFRVLCVCLDSMTPRPESLDELLESLAEVRPDLECDSDLIISTALLRLEGWWDYWENTSGIEFLDKLAVELEPRHWEMVLKNPRAIEYLCEWNVPPPGLLRKLCSTEKFKKLIGIDELSDDELKAREKQFYDHFGNESIKEQQAYLIHALITGGARLTSPVTLSFADVRNAVVLPDDDGPAYWTDPHSDGPDVLGACCLLLMLLDAGCRIAEEDLLRSYQLIFSLKEHYGGSDTDCEWYYETGRFSDCRYQQLFVISQLIRTQGLPRDFPAARLLEYLTDFYGASKEYRKNIHLFRFKLLRSLLHKDKLRSFLLASMPWSSDPWESPCCFYFRLHERYKVKHRIEKGHKSEVDIVVDWLHGPFERYPSEILTALLHVPSDYSPPEDRRGKDRALQFVDLPRDVQRDIIEKTDLLDPLTPRKKICFIAQRVLKSRALCEEIDQARGLCGRVPRRTKGFLQSRVWPDAEDMLQGGPLTAAFEDDEEEFDEEGDWGAAWAENFYGDSESDEMTDFSSSDEEGW